MHKHLERPPLTLHCKACPNGKCLANKHRQTLFGDQTFYRLATLFGAVWLCLVMFDKIWRSSNIWWNNLKHFFCSCVWWAMFCLFGQLCDASMHTMLAQQFVSIHTASCLHVHTSLVQCFKNGEQRRTFSGCCWKWGDSYPRNAES